MPVTVALFFVLRLGYVAFQGENDVNRGAHSAPYRLSPCLLITYQVQDYPRGKARRKAAGGPTWIDLVLGRTLSAIAAGRVTHMEVGNAWAAAGCAAW